MTKEEIAAELLMGGKLYRGLDAITQLNMGAVIDITRQASQSRVDRAEFVDDSGEFCVLVYSDRTRQAIWDAKEKAMQRVAREYMRALSRLQRT